MARSDGRDDTAQGWLGLGAMQASGPAHTLYIPIYTSLPHHSAHAPVPSEAALVRIFAWAKEVPLKFAIVSEDGGVFALDLAPRPLENHSHIQKVKAAAEERRRAGVEQRQRAEERRRAEEQGTGEEGQQEEEGEEEEEKVEATGNDAASQSNATLSALVEVGRGGESARDEEEWAETAVDTEECDTE